jgi:uncharacterized membrane protein YbaN (DUF454 family)
MRATAKRWAMLLAGWGFILLGIAGLFLPVLQGILFLFIGLLILSSEYVWAHRLLTNLRERYPTVTQRAHAASVALRAVIQRIFHRSDNHKRRSQRSESRFTPSAPR